MSHVNYASLSTVTLINLVRDVYGQEVQIDGKSRLRYLTRAYPAVPYALSLELSQRIDEVRSLQAAWRVALTGAYVDARR